MIMVEFVPITYHIFKLQQMSGGGGGKVHLPEGSLYHQPISSPRMHCFTKGLMSGLLLLLPFKVEVYNFCATTTSDIFCQTRFSCSDKRVAPQMYAIVQATNCNLVPLLARNYTLHLCNSLVSVMAVSH